MSPGLTNLPYEILWYIVAAIDVDDVVNLAHTCRSLRCLETERSVCKRIMETKFPFSPESLTLSADGGDYGSAFRRLSKTREAVASNSPYSAAIVGFGDTYLYCHGVLCYTIDDSIRILHLHDSGQEEAVIEIPRLVEEAIFGKQPRLAGTFLLLYYSDGILSCLYRLSSPGAGAWLIAFHEERQAIIFTASLDSTEKLFVRNNAHFLYYGTHSETSQDGHKKWLLRGYEFQAKAWFENKICLQDLIGSEINSTICFEIFEGHFYAVSNQTTFEVEEIDWTSFYHCVRFPLDSPCMKTLEVSEDKDMWRRQHLEGPLDDRWTSLRLQRDFVSGNVKILEVRKEWINGGSTGHRTCYTTEMIFARREINSATNSLSTSESLTSSLTISSTQLTSLPSSVQTFAALTQDRLALTLTSNDKPHFLPPQTRLPRNVHPESNGSKLATSLFKTRVKYYNSLGSSFFYLINDLQGSEFQGHQCLRIQVCSRRPGPPERDGNGFLVPESLDPRTGRRMIGLNETFKSSASGYWPPNENSDRPSDPHLFDLYRLLNPPTHLGDIEGIADEKSLVYCTGGRDQPKAIIFICFDPGVKLIGLRDWQGSRSVAGLPRRIYDMKNGDKNVERCNRKSGNVASCEGANKDISEKGRNPEHVKAPIGVNKSTESPSTPESSSTSLDEGFKTSWVRREQAMYRAIARGYNFGLS